MNEAGDRDADADVDDDDEVELSVPRPRRRIREPESPALEPVMEGNEEEEDEEEEDGKLHHCTISRKSDDLFDCLIFIG